MNQNSTINYVFSKEDNAIFIISLLHMIEMKFEINETFQSKK
jgi:hypothetical protein